MSRWSRHADVVHTELEDGAVLLHMGTKFYYSLNGTGGTIWGLLESIDNPAELTAHVRDRYQLTDDHARASVARFLSALEREQLIVASPDGGVSVGRAPAVPGTERTGVVFTPTTSTSFGEPELIKHDEPLHEVVMNPFDPQLPLAE